MYIPLLHVWLRGVTRNSSDHFLSRPQAAIMHSTQHHASSVLRVLNNFTSVTFVFVYKRLHVTPDTKIIERIFKPSSATQVISPPRHQNLRWYPTIPSFLRHRTARQDDQWCSHRSIRHCTYLRDSTHQCRSLHLRSRSCQSGEWISRRSSNTWRSSRNPQMESTASYPRNTWPSPMRCNTLTGSNQGKGLNEEQIIEGVLREMNEFTIPSRSSQVQLRRIDPQDNLFRENRGWSSFGGLAYHQAGYGYT